MALTKVPFSMIKGAEINVLDFGAVGDGISDDSSGIQAAIDYAASLNDPAPVLDTPVVVLFPAGYVFLIGVGYRSGIAAGVAGIVIRDFITYKIEGTIKAKSGIYGPGTLSALLKSPDAGNTGVTITGSGTVDGNRDNQLFSTQCDNIYLRAIYQVTVNSIKSKNANGNGIMIVKVDGGSNHVDTAVVGTTVSGCNSIGIQVSRSAANLIISNNRVTSCLNNCIDVYNENGSVIADPGIISIVGNTVSNGLVGIFPETTQNCSVVGNSISYCTYAGIHTNRINGQPRNVVISSNNITKCPHGVVSSGDTGGVLITTNAISDFSTAGVKLSGQTVSSNTVSNNMFIPDSDTVPIISLQGTTLVWNQLFNNVCNRQTHNPSYGVVTSGTVGDNTLEPIIYSVQKRPVKKSQAGNTTSGGTLVIAVAALSAGRLVIRSSSGGSWRSIWTGAFCSSSTAVAIVQESTTFVSTGNNVSSVTVTGVDLNITVNWAATGSTGEYNYWIEYI